jgi:hypothetical protein
MWNWLRDCYKGGYITIEELERVMKCDRSARSMWEHWADGSDDFMSYIREQVGDFLRYIKKKENRKSMENCEVKEEVVQMEMDLENKESVGVSGHMGAVPCPVNAKRDIVRFTGEKAVAINLEHVTIMSVEGSVISFEFYAKEQRVKFDTEEAAIQAFEYLLRTWASHGE